VRSRISKVRAAWWALLAARRIRAELRNHNLAGALDPTPPPSLPAEGKRGVQAALRWTRQSCLVRSIVMQAWLAAHDEERDLVIGVKAPNEEFGAHAWLEGDPPHGDGPFHELVRYPA
jgi:transglutaminase superfamily protein